MKWKKNENEWKWNKCEWDGRYSLNEIEINDGNCGHIYISIVLTIKFRTFTNSVIIMMSFILCTILVVFFYYIALNE